MKTSIIVVLISFLCGSPIFSQDKQLDNVFYCFNNGIRTLPNAPKSLADQAALIKKIGFDGLSGHISDDYWARRKALDKAGVGMPEIYWGMTLTDDGQIEYKEEIKEIIKDSKDLNLLVALFLNAKKYMNHKSEGDKIFADGIQALADFAASYHVDVAIYPHANNYSETLAHSVKMAKQINRRNVGVIFNTCHLLKVEGEEGWQEKAKQALPYLFMVSINGADSGETQKMGWDRLIQPLGQGTFDTYELVKFFKDNGYHGKFGLQCYNIKQDCKAALTQSMNTWRTYQKRYAEETSIEPSGATAESFLQAWASGFGKGSVDDMTAFYEDSKDTFVIQSTGRARKGTADIRKEYQSAFEEVVFERVTLGDLTVRQQGDMAWATCRFKALTSHRVTHTKWTLEVYTSFVLKRFDNTWKIVLEQSTPIAGVPRVSPQESVRQ
ncbi:MAG: TIM barrel protein [Phycisphaeraceae bacterium]|nr:TIM barrel protein [Phycisphaeraceae bacterium]